IENHTFYGCTSLKEVTLPQTILKIEEYAFRDCAFTQFTPKITAIVKQHNFVKMFFMIFIFLDY
ncbi:MAG: leucine-rich repeat protein, partial [Bacteroidales bacterium]|nr:leucine-rich repeat protein [Bacteroidales bacterium]